VFLMLVLVVSGVALVASSVIIAVTTWELEVGIPSTAHRVDAVIYSIYRYKVGLIHGTIDVDPVLGENPCFEDFMKPAKEIYKHLWLRRKIYTDKEKYDAVMGYYDR